VAEAYLPLLVLLVVAGAVVVAMIGLSVLLGPKRPTPAKLDVFECGARPLDSPRRRFSVKFYLVALLFLLFDIEVVFLYPWAVLFRELGLFGLVEMAVFILIMGAGLLYVFARGALEWE